MSRKRTYIMLTAVLVVLALSGCRRDLWVYTDDIRQVELYTDWSRCDSRPDGMTAWFISNDNDGRNRRITTAEVEHAWLNLPRGRFTGIIFDWSPAEYANQEFVGMTRPDSALVKVRPATVQPAADEELYGVKAVPGNMPIPLVESTGMHLLCVTPDPMCADTLRNVEIVTGVDGDLVKWTDRDEYEESLVHQTFHCQPQPITWNLRIMIRIKGAQYLHSVQATVAGLAEGTWLGSLRHSPLRYRFRFHRHFWTDNPLIYRAGRHLPSLFYAVLNLLLCGRHLWLWQPSAPCFSGLPVAKKPYCITILTYRPRN